MYFLLTWSITPGATPDNEIVDLVFDRMAEFTPNCEIIKDHSFLFRAKGGGAFDDLLFDLHQIRESCGNQLNWALIQCGERNFDGDGFDRAAAMKVIK